MALAKLCQRISVTVRRYMSTSANVIALCLKQFATRRHDMHRAQLTEGGRKCDSKTLVLYSPEKYQVISCAEGLGDVGTSLVLVYLPPVPCRMLLILFIPTAAEALGCQMELIWWVWLSVGDYLVLMFFFSSNDISGSTADPKSKLCT